MIKITVEYGLGQYKDEGYIATITCTESNLPLGKNIFGYGGHNTVRIYPLLQWIPKKHSSRGVDAPPAAPYTMQYISKSFRDADQAEAWVESIENEIEKQHTEYDDAIDYAQVPPSYVKVIQVGREPRVGVEEP